MEKNSARIWIVLPPEDKATLIKLADHDGRSLCSMVRWLIRQHAAELRATKTTGAAA
jgi:hypothetical protein